MSEGPISTAAELSARSKELYELGQHDPHEALQRTRSLAARPALADQIANVRAGLFIDVGQKARARDAVREGIALLEALYLKDPGQITYAYNLANGLIALSQLDE